MTLTQWRPWLLPLLITLGLTGCESLSTGSFEMPDIFGSQSRDENVVKRQIAFPAEEYAKLEKHGTAAVQGRLSYTTPSGQTIVGANETISVAPATRYAAEAADVALSGRRIEPADPRARDYTHYAKTDDNGYFVVRGIPAGVFYVAGSVLLPGGEARSPIIIKQVTLRDGKTREVELSR
ncbi:MULTISPECIES: carboxypeptidase regulatory-like domain-containing protein [unclassified Salinicola]|uniref:carboxypeptidase regulatory-like domain-containing protein n=1 Tax=unclassified Salinicola TaxID=2634022 RepID=UPI001A8D7D67|nr:MULTISPECIES: carboxypeptidase regulatory-like domain-containing protein [unclassified Salinicola]MCE3026500.1 carboxypeptidase regulatory-like domain-containing protein [Salinicola sp. DM10]WIX31698.1 carboxypeptidase regulatory-like domain-containing protein [Salinicola sp. JS01]